MSATAAVWLPANCHRGNFMGTDIYLHAEQKSGAVWHYCGELEELEVRNYEFFAILANVRNPIRSTERFDYIVQPRGFPNDMSEELRKDSLLFYGHDPGWVSLRELLDFDWEGKTIPRSAVVKVSLAHLFQDGKQPFPKDWITGPFKSWLGRRVTWVETYKDAVGAEFLTRLFDTLTCFGSPEDVRIVFSFDS